MGESAGLLKLCSKGGPSLTSSLLLPLSGEEARLSLLHQRSLVPCLQLLAGPVSSLDSSKVSEEIMPLESSLLPCMSPQVPQILDGGSSLPWDTRGMVCESFFNVIGT